MARRKRTEQDPAGADSFLDITMNVVGILIILVMVVGERAKTAPVEVEPPEPSAELVAARNEALTLEEDVRGLQEKMASVRSEMQLKALERGHLQTLITAVEQQLEAEQKKLGEKAERRYEIDRDLAIAQEELKRVEDERQLVEKAAEAQTVQVESYPTPLGKVVDGEEAHIQLKNGRLAVLPLDFLMARLRGVMREDVQRMGNQSEVVEMIGPIEGFRMRYVISRQQIAHGTLFQLQRVEFLPVSSQLGELVEDALAPGSEFRNALARMSPDRYTITVWTYPESFRDFARLKKELYQMGYAVAARPLPQGMPIGASPNGSKSSAQ